MTESPEKDAPREQSGWGKDVVWLAAMVVVAGIAAYPSLLIAPNHWDSSLFLWEGKRMLAGDLPYAAVWDQKFPVLLWLNALAAATGHAYGTLFLIQAAAIGAGGWLISLMARRQVGVAAGLAAGFAYATLASRLCTLDTGNLSEIYAAPFAILCMYAMVRHVEGGHPPWLWPTVSGLGLGTAVILRPPLVLIGAALLPLLPAARRSSGLRRAALLAFIGGCLLMPLGTVLWAASKGILGFMIQDCVLHNLAYAAGTQVPEFATWDYVGRSLRGTAALTWVWHLSGLVGLFIVMLGADGAGAEPKARRHPGLRGLAVVWLIAAFASSLPSLRFYAHYYYPTLAPLALLSAWAWRELLLRFFCRPRRRMAAAWALAAVALLFVGLQVRWDYGEAAERRRGGQAVADMEQFLVLHGRSGDTLGIFGWGNETDLLARLGWPSPTKHPHAIIYPDLPGGPRRLREWSEEMIRTPPVWLVCSPHQDLIQGNILPGYGWNAGALEIARPVVEMYKNRFYEVARFPVQGRRTKSDPAYYVIYRDRNSPPLP